MNEEERAWSESLRNAYRPEELTPERRAALLEGARERAAPRRPYRSSWWLPAAGLAGTAAAAILLLSTAPVDKHPTEDARVLAWEEEVLAAGSLTADSGSDVDRLLDRELYTIALLVAGRGRP